MTSGRSSDYRESLEPGRLRGAIFRAHLRWVGDNHGDSGLVKVWSAIPPETAAALVGQLQDTSLYDFRHLIALDRAIGTLFGPDERATMIELGRWSARRNLTMSPAESSRHEPHEFFARAARFQAQFADFGKAVYERSGATRCLVRLEECPCYSKLFCWSGLGYYLEAAELHGGRRPAVEETGCLCEGGPACVYDVRWELPGPADLPR